MPESSASQATLDFGSSGIGIVVDSIRLLLPHDLEEFAKDRSTTRLHTDPAFVRYGRVCQM